MATLTINGIAVEADESQTLLDVIRERRLADIPTLCHVEKTDPFGSCSLCLAEVEGAPALRRTCATPVAHGMVVHTETDKVKRSRKTNLELLLARHTADCYAPCRLGCPANVDIQGYIALASRGLYAEAVKLMKETNPLPIVCGRVCAKPCEAACRRNFIDEPVDIKNIKRFVADRGLARGDIYVPEPGKPTGRSVAIIGTGPAGLSAAYFLRLAGHRVVMFEAMPEPGGMMRYGIPEYRLPKKDLRAEIDAIFSMGVDVRYNVVLGRDFTLTELQDDFDAVFIAHGAQVGASMRTTGEDNAGVMQGVDFLRDVNLGTAPRLSGTVFVVGGGNTAIDAARTALRHGAEKVTIIYRRTEKEMPAAVEEIEDAKEERIDIRILTNPVAYKGENGRLTGVTFIKMELGAPDASGRRSPVVMEGSEYTERADYVIEAIGQKVVTDFLTGLKLTRWNSIDADGALFSTNMDGVYAGGDAVTGPSVIIGAVAHGRKAAYAMNRLLSGRSAKAENRLGFHVKKEDFGALAPEDFKDKPRLPRRHIEKADPETRTDSFTEVELGFTEENLLEETRRCLQCGCQDVTGCDLRRYATLMGADKTRFMPKNPKTERFADHTSPHATEEANPFIIRDFNKCVLCGSCVQVCNDIQVNDAIDLGFRGVRAKIIAGIDLSLKDSACVFCGSCVQACPVGALTEKNVVYRGKPWEESTTRSTCGYCGVGCQIDIHTRDGAVTRITGAEESAPNYGSLCVKGRYGFDFIASKERLTRPLIKENGRFRDATWTEALDLTARRLKEISERHGDAAGVLTSARVTNEENYIAQKFARTALKTNNIDHCARLCHASTVAGLAAAFGSGAMTNPISDIEKADVILVTGSNTTETHPVISSAIKRAVKFGKKKLIVLDPREIPLKQHAHIKMSPNPGSDVAWINGMVRVILAEGLEDKDFIGARTEGFDALKEAVAPFTPDHVEALTGIPGATLVEAARLYASAEKGSILYCMGITQHTTGTDNVKALANLAMVCGNLGIEGGGVNPLRGQNNVQGACDMGGLPDVYPGYRKVHDEAHAQALEKAWGVTGLSRKTGLTATEMVAEALTGNLKALYIIGENPLVSEADLNHAEKAFHNLEFLVVQDIFLTETAQAADVVLPALCFAEKEGTFTNTERRVQRVRKAVDGPSGVPSDWEITCEIARRMGTPMSYDSAEAIFDEIASVTPTLAGLSYGRLTGDGIPWPCPTPTHPGTPRLHVGGFAKGKGTFFPIAFAPAAETPDADYPLVLTTGRVLCHYHTGTMTRKSDGLNQQLSECFVEMARADANERGLNDGDMATLFSRRGKITAKVNISGRMTKGTVFVPFHFAEAAANRLTNATLDPVAKIPEFKVCAVTVVKA